MKTARRAQQAIPNGDINAARENWLRQALSDPEVLRQLAPHLQGSSVPVGVPPSLSSQPRAGYRGPVMSAEDDLSNMFADRRARYR